MVVRQDESPTLGLVPAMALDRAIVCPRHQVGVDRDTRVGYLGHVAKEYVQPAVPLFGVIGVLGIGAKVNAPQPPRLGVGKHRPTLGVHQVGPPLIGSRSQLTDPHCEQRFDTINHDAIFARTDPRLSSLSTRIESEERNGMPATWQPWETLQRTYSRCTLAGWHQLRRYARAASTCGSANTKSAFCERPPT